MYFQITVEITNLGVTLHSEMRTTLYPNCSAPKFNLGI